VSPVAAFTVWFFITVTLLLTAAYFGRTAARAPERRKIHVIFVLLTAGALAWTIKVAYDLGALYDLASAGWITPVHLAIAKVATGFLVFPIVAGILAWRDGKKRRAHAFLAWCAMVLIVLAAVTGTIMILLAQPKGL
jgi:hypothetical protein